MIPLNSPFHPDNDAGYQVWREAKLAGYPSRGEDLIVEVRDPHALTDAEYRAILDRVARTNMAVYATSLGEAEDKAAVRALSAQFGLTRLDANWLADEDGISSLTPRDDGAEKRGDYIPYTHHRIRWHTDGYYNPEHRRILAMTLHCVREAAEGGDNELYDQDLAYIALRDSNPEFIRALMAPDAMTIPARIDESPLPNPLPPAPQGLPSVAGEGANAGPKALPHPTPLPPAPQGLPSVAGEGANAGPKTRPHPNPLPLAGEGANAGPKTINERPEEPGPVFLIDPVSGGLHLRYTARTKSIAWKDDPTTLAAVKAIEDLLASQPLGWFRLKLQPGMGLLCNNVLHTRDGFSDTPDRRRLLYRARYHDRIRDLRS